MKDNQHSKKILQQLSELVSLQHQHHIFYQQSSTEDTNLLELVFSCSPSLVSAFNTAAFTDKHVNISHELQIAIDALKKSTPVTHNLHKNSHHNNAKHHDGRKDNEKNLKGSDNHKKDDSDGRAHNEENFHGKNHEDTTKK